MADSDFSVKAIIEANTSNFDKGMKQAQASATNLSNTFGNLSKIITKALSFAGLAVGTKAIVDFGKSCVQSANQAIKTFNILDNTIKATGADAWTSTKELDSMAKTLSDSTNYSVTEIENMQSVLLGFREITGETFQDASNAVLDMATVMGMDLTSAVQTVGKALDDPIRGLDSLRRQGFQFTDEQKAELAQMVKNGKKIEAQKVILDELANSYGGASKAGQDSFAKQRHAVENFKDALGGKLIPVVKVFAEDNAKMINSLRELVEKTDFTPIVNIVTNLKKVISETFDKISEYIKKVGAEIQDFVSRFNFKPIISVIDTLAGTFITAFDRIKSRFNESSEIMNQLKESLIDFSNSEMFQKIINIINGIIDAIVFLWGEIERVAGEIRVFVVGKIIEIWNKIKELFQNSQDALANSESDIKSWGGYFYSIFNNIFRIAQDLINSVSALLNGDWQVAWEYAKLAVLRVAESVATTLESIKNGFKDKMQEMLSIASLAVKFLPGGMGIALSTALKGLEGLTNTSSKMRNVIQEQVEETENKIQELTGHTADIAIKDLQGVSTQFAGFTSSALGFIQDLTDGVETETEKQKKYFSSVPRDSESSYKAFSEWDSKLLQQRLDKLKEHGKEYTKEFHDINLALIEEERKKALEADKTGAETDKINEYYNNEISKEDKRFSDEKKKHWRETLNKIIGFMKTFAQTAINVFKKVASGIKTAISGIGNIFSKLFSFNVDDALDNLLKFEDSILTFFVETLPKLPAFFESAIQSIIILIQTVLNVLDFNQISNIIESIIKTIGTLITTIAKYINDNSEKLTNGLIQLVKTVIDGFSNWIKSGGWKELLNAILTIQKMIENVVSENLPAIVDTIIEMLPDLIDTLIASIVSASKTLSRIIKPIIKLVLALIDAIIEVITSDEVMDASLDAIMALVDAIIDDLLPGIFKLIPKLIVKIIAQVIKNFPKIVKSLIDGFIKAFTKVNWFEIVKQIFMGFIDAFKDLFGIHSPSTLFEGFGLNIVEGLVNGLKGMADTLNSILQPIYNLVVNIFGQIGNIITSSISVSFSGLTSLLGGINSGIAQITNSVANLINSLANLIDKANQAVSALNPLSGGSSGGGGYGAHSTGSTAGDIAVDLFVPGGFLRHFFANGSNSVPQGLALVGEAGPELVKFRGGEQVLNNRNTNKALENMGGKTNNFNVTFNNLQDTTAFNMMQQLKAYNRQMAINGII